MTDKKKITIEQQIEAMKAVVVAEEFRQIGLVARGEITQEEADQWLAQVRACLATLAWIEMNRSAFMGFMRTHAQAGPAR